MIGDASNTYVIRVHRFLHFRKYLGKHRQRKVIAEGLRVDV